MDAGQTLYIANNAWKAIHMTYEITRNTMVAFDFKSSREGEIHGLGFDNDDGISYGYTFKVHGTQNWGISNFDNYAGGSAWQSYTIPVGEFYVGTASRFFFCADQDGGTRNGNAWFRNVRIFEGTDCQTGNLTPLTGQAAPAAESLAVWVYPNPVTSGQLQLQVDHPTTGVANWQILTLTGQVLQEQELTVDQQTYQQNISISALARGTYLLRWRDQGREQTVRFTVQ